MKESIIIYLLPKASGQFISLLNKWICIIKPNLRECEIKATPMLLDYTNVIGTFNGWTN